MTNEAPHNKRLQATRETRAPEACRSAAGSCGMIPPLDESRLRDQARAWLSSGVAVPEVERWLLESGVGPEQASRIVDEVLGGQVSDASAAQRRQTRTSLIWGVALCVLGALLVVVGIIGFAWPEVGFPAHVGVFAGGLAGVGAGVMQILRATL